MEINFTYLIPLAVLAMLIALIVYAEARATIIGRISHMNGVPAANTQVRLAGQITYTDGVGRFKIDDVRFGKHEMAIRRSDGILKVRALNVRKPEMVLYETVP